MSEEVNRKLPTGNTIAQLLTVYTQTLNGTMYSITDGQTDDIMVSIADHTLYNSFMVG